MNAVNPDVRLNFSTGPESELTRELPVVDPEVLAAEQADEQSEETRQLPRILAVLPEVPEGTRIISITPDMMPPAPAAVSGPKRKPRPAPEVEPNDDQTVVVPLAPRRFSRRKAAKLQEGPAPLPKQYVTSPYANASKVRTYYVDPEDAVEAQDSEAAYGEDSDRTDKFTILDTIRDYADEQLDTMLPRLFTGKYAAGVLGMLIATEAQKIFEQHSFQLQAYSSRRRPGNYVKTSVDLAIGRVIDMSVTMEQAGKNAFGEALGLRVRPYTIDAQVPLAKNRDGTDIMGEVELDILTVNGSTAARVIEYESMPGRPDSKVLARKDITHDIVRAVDGREAVGRTYETMMLVSDPTAFGRILLAGIKPLFVQAPGEPAALVSEVAAVGLNESAAQHFRHYVLSPGGQINLNAQSSYVSDPASIGRTTFAID